MESILVDDRKVEELVEQTVQKHFKLAFENVEEVRKSPAVTLIRIEDRLNTLEARIGRDMVTKAELIAARGEFKQENASLHEELKQENAKLRTELKEESARTRSDLKLEAANNRTEFTNELGKFRTEVANEFGKLRAEFKDEIWKMRLWIIVLGILVVLNNPKVIELIGKLFSAFKP
jgi:aspartyl-tRNA synthetase